MSKAIKTSEEVNSNNDDLHSITNVKELDANSICLSHMDQFKNLSLSFYNDIPLYNSQASTNFTNKSNNSTKEDSNKINNIQNTKKLMGNIFKSTTNNFVKKPFENIKPKATLNKPSNNPINSKNFYLNSRFGKTNWNTSNKLSTKTLDASVSKSKFNNFSQISNSKTKSPMPKELKKNFVNNVKITLKDTKKSGLNSSFNDRSISRGNKKKIDLSNTSFSSLMKSMKTIRTIKTIKTIPKNNLDKKLIIKVEAQKNVENNKIKKKTEEKRPIILKK